MIRLGVCTPIENAALLKSIGYDYIELGLSRVATMEESEYQELLAAVKASPLPVEAMNSMVPSDFSLCSDEGTGERIRAYLKKAFARAEELGVEIVVFGSGGARKMPPDMSESEGYRRLSQFLRVAARIAEDHYITIAIEPLRSAECNIINLVGDAQNLAGMTGFKNVAALADLYHMMQEGDYYDYLDNGIGVIHTHIAEMDNRTFPKASDPCAPEYQEFLSRLKKAGYDGRISIEARTDDLAADAVESFRLLDYLRR